MNYWEWKDMEEANAYDHLTEANMRKVTYLLISTVWQWFPGARTVGGKNLQKKEANTLLMLPRWLSGQEFACQCRRCRFDPWVSLITGSGRFPEEGNDNPATHSSILAWKIPWIEEPGGYSPWGSKRVRHDLVTKQQHLNIYIPGPSPGLTF